MYAIKPKGVGLPVRFRRVLDPDDLANGELFVVNEKPAGMVLAEDGLSLRNPTPQESVDIYREDNVVSRYQAIMALYNAGLLADVEALMSDPGTDKAIVIAYQETESFHRMSTSLLAAQSLLGWTDAQVDTLFEDAKAITHD